MDVSEKGKSTTSARQVFLVIAVILLIAALVSMALDLTASAGFDSTSHGETVTPSAHCDGGECCIMSECTCPSCEGRGDPGGVCDRCGENLCPDCGNCDNCGTSPCPHCRDTCFECGSFNLCDTCNGCLDCGYNRDPDCLECGDFLFFIADTGNVIPVGEPPVTLFSNDGFDILLFAPFGTPAWAIINVVLTVAGVILTFATIIRAVGRKKGENNEIDKYVALFHVDSYVDTQTLIILNDDERYNKRRRLWVFVTMYVLSIAAVMFLVLIQDFRGVIALFDWWTIIHSMLFAGIVICCRLVFRKPAKRLY